MAILKNTVVTGNMSITDTLYSTTAQFSILKAPTTSSGSTFGIGTNGQVICSNGTSIYWNTLGNISLIDLPTTNTTTTFLRGDGTWSAPVSLHTANIGTISDTLGSALQTYFVNNSSTIARDQLLSFYTYADNKYALTMGYFLDNNDVAPYGGFFVAQYDTPHYIGINNGVYSNQTILTDASPVSVANGGTGTNTKLKAGLLYSWTAKTQGQTWSRIFYMPVSSSNIGSTCILNVNATRTDVVYNYTFLITAHHPKKCHINMIQGNTYNTLKVRGVVDYSGNLYFEIYDDLNSIVSGTSQNVKCNLWVLTKGSTEPTLYTAFTDGTTIPSDSADFQMNLIASGGIQTNGKVYGAVWNDYAEYRRTNSAAKPGQCVIDNTDGTLDISTQRLQPGAQIVSDTFGFAIGETKECQTPLAVSGRVLVYPYCNRYEYKAGMCVCSAPNGTVDIMTREEIQQYPDCIVGIVSEVPEYETWGTENVAVDGRIWIKVK